MLDHYTLEQMETLAQCVWQHKITQFNVVAYALGGQDARERVPDQDHDDQDAPGGSMGWEAAHGRWNLGRRDADGRVVPVRPTITPEADQRNKERALAQLLGVQGALATAAGQPRPVGIPTTTADPTGPTVSDAKMRSQLDAATKPGGQ